jgi:hypothetical protein
MTDLNPGFGGPQDMLHILFLTVTFILFQMKSFKQFFFEFHAILTEVKNCQDGTFETLQEIQNLFWPKD